MDDMDDCEIESEEIEPESAVESEDEKIQAMPGGSRGFKKYGVRLSSSVPRAPGPPSFVVSKPSNLHEFSLVNLDTGTPANHLTLSPSLQRDCLVAHAVIAGSTDEKRENPRRVKITNGIIILDRQFQVTVFTRSNHRWEIELHKQALKNKNRQTLSQVSDLLLCIGVPKAAVDEALCNPLKSTKCDIPGGAGTINDILTKASKAVPFPCFPDKEFKSNVTAEAKASFIINPSMLAVLLVRAAMFCDLPEYNTDLALGFHTTSGNNIDELESAASSIVGPGGASTEMGQRHVYGKGLYLAGDPGYCGLSHIKGSDAKGRQCIIIFLYIKGRTKVGEMDEFRPTDNDGNPFTRLVTPKNVINDMTAGGPDNNTEINAMTSKEDAVPIMICYL
jgi:hypothetical protein